MTARFLENAPLVVAVLLLVDSLHFVFARLLLPYLPPQQSAMYVLAVATVETAVFLAATGNIRLQVFRQHAWFFLVIGFLVASSTVINYMAIAFVDPGTASLLGKTSILFALGLGIFWLHDRLTLIELAGSLVAIAGVFAISFQPGDFLRLGSFMILGSSFMYALHTAVVKRYGGEMDFANFFLFRVAATTGFLLLFAVASPGGLIWPGATAWFFLILTGTVDVVISRVLYYLALRRLQMSFHAIILTLSPVITILWSWLLFGSWPTLQGFLGGTAVISGVGIVTMRRRSKELPVSSQALEAD